MASVLSTPAMPMPMTNAELAKAIEGYRQQLDNFAHVTSMNLLHLKEALEARLIPSKTC